MSGTMMKRRSKIISSSLVILSSKLTDNNSDPPKIEVVNDDDDGIEDEQDWISDRELIQRASNLPDGESLTNRNRYTLKKLKSSGLVLDDDDDYDDHEQHSRFSSSFTPPRRLQQQQQGGGGGNVDDDGSDSDRIVSSPVERTQKSIYTDEEEELINAMGGRGDGGGGGNNDASSSSSSPSKIKESSLSSKKREDGYLGDCTLMDISRDYSVPICYIADVLCKWGCRPPINVNDKLGDLVTGEQAFALLEALLTLDISAINDGYSYDDLVTICDEYDIDLKDGFEFCIKEKKWNLPFGVRTFLRVEQEKELIRVLADDYVVEDDSGEEEYVDDD